MTFPYFEFDAPSAQECHEQDCELELGRGWPEDLAEILESLEDFGELARKIAAVIRIRSQDQAALAHFAAGELREYLARVMAKERA